MNLNLLVAPNSLRKKEVARLRTVRVALETKKASGLFSVKKRIAWELNVVDVAMTTSY